MPPTVTIGLPFYNAATTLADAIRSVFAQSFEDWELLLVDDGSTDDSLEVARAVKDPRISVLSDGANRELSFRLNQIAALAGGRYLARMDADDLMHPDRLKRQIEHLAAARASAVIGTATYTIDAGARPTGVRGERPPGTSVASVLRHGALIHPSVTGHTRWFRSNPYDPAYVRAEDLELWCRTVVGTRFASIRTPLYFYREDRLSVSGYLASCATVRRILQRYGPPALGRLATLLLLARTRAKALSCRALAGIGAEDLMFHPRSRALTADEAQKAEHAIRRVLSTAVPGLPARA